MTTVILNKWDGGQAEDVRTTETNQSEESNNFDIFTEPYRLNPYSDSIADTADVAIDDSEISDVGVCQISGTDYIVGVGYESGASTAIAFYTKTSLTAQFIKQAVATGNSFVKGSAITYKKLAFAVDSNGSGTYRLIRFNSAGSVTTIGSISASAGNKVISFIHPEDNVLYIFIENVIARWDGTTFTTVNTILPANFSVSSTDAYGAYISIVLNPQSGNANPISLLWGRDMTLNTLQGSLDLGEGYCGIVVNLYNILFFIMSPSTAFTSNNQNKIIVKAYSGGAVETIAELNDSSSLSIGQVYHYKAKKNNKVYFGFANSDCVWTFGKNKGGRYAITQDRFITNGTQIAGFPATQVLSGISIIGDVIWVGGFSQTGTYTLMRSRIVSSEGLVYTATSKFTTTVNPGMAIGDRYKQKQLDAVQIAFTGSLLGITGLKYSVDGSDFESIISETNTAGEHIFEATADTNGAPLKEGREFKFQPNCTGGTKIKEIRYRYTVKDTTL